ncbi:hypothetical protein CPB86DRAFT_593356 [Serendipita vermifera]|nr:hypothetical protein CPB86DRAFT_593356 [Serendipita vermifera]
MSSSSKPAAGMAPAAAALAEVEKLINDEAQASNPDMKKRKNRIRHILSNVNKAMGVLERVADVHPATQVVFIVFKGLLKLEMDRRENSEHIVVLYHPMARMLSVLSHLEQIVLDNEDDPVTQHLAEVLSSVAQTMEEFGDLSDLYYNKCKQPIVRFLKAGDFKKKIEDFHDRFAKHRKEIQEALVLRNEFRGKEMSEEIERLRVNTEKIIARLGEPSSDQEVKALEIVRQYGKDYILHDKVKLEEVSALVGGGKVSGHTQALLDTSIDSLLASNMDQFHRKLESSMNQITDSINKSRDAILKKLDSGPHELIEDPDVKTVWQSNGWKLSVKCRHFVDELSNHYEEKFRNEATEDEPKDRWTLPIFSKVMYHPAIGDAIDEDGSGFISIYEVNSFLTSRPEGWTLTEWLVYWAIGWRMNCVRYNESLMDSLGDIRDKCESLIQSGDENIKHHVQQYLQKIQILDKVVLWSENENAQIEDTQDLSPESEEKLQNLLDQISDKQVAELKTRLDELKWLLDDPADIPVLLGGADARVEQVFLCIADLILGRQLEDLTTKQIEDGDWEIMTETLHMLIGVFHERMQSLLRGWRAQKLNVDLNITCFAGGVYSGWHAAYFNPNGEMKRLLEKKPNNGQASSQNNSQADALATLLIQVSFASIIYHILTARPDEQSHRTCRQYGLSNG